MTSSPHSQPAPNVDPGRERDRAVIEALLTGTSIEQCAYNIRGFDGSVLAVYECLNEHFPSQELRAILARQDEARAIRLDLLKETALNELEQMVHDDTALNSLTINQARALDAQRRTAIAILRIKPFPTARDSYNDARGPSLSSRPESAETKQDTAPDIKALFDALLKNAPRDESFDELDDFDDRDNFDDPAEIDEGNDKHNVTVSSCDPTPLEPAPLSGGRRGQGERSSESLVANPEPDTDTDTNTHAPDRRTIPAQCPHTPHQPRTRPRLHLAAGIADTLPPTILRPP